MCILLIMTFPIVQMVSCRGPPQNTGPQAIACLACPIATPLNVYLQNHHWLCTPLTKFITSDLCASRSLHSASERCFIVHPKEAQNHFYIKCSLLPNSIRSAESLAISKNWLKTEMAHIFHLWYTSSIFGTHLPSSKMAHIFHLYLTLLLWLSQF